MTVDATSFVYHASTDGQEVRYLYPQHPIPFGDWGDGGYLSDDYTLSKLWGASDTNSAVASINTYTISDQINYLNGYVIDPQDNNDLITWAASIAFPRQDKMRRELSKQLNPEYVDYAIDSVIEAYRVFQVEDFINSCDWIISKRSDDGLWRIILEFFTDNLDISGLRTIYSECSFGDQLVLKKQAASDCVIFESCEHYDKNTYYNAYEQSVRDRTSFFNQWKSQHRDINDLRCHDILWNEVEYQQEDFF